VNDPDATGINVPDKGLSTSTYYKRLWRILDQRYDVVLIILDEIDKLDDDAILMQLFASRRGRQDHRLQAWSRGYQQQDPVQGPHGRTSQIESL